MDLERISGMRKEELKNFLQLRVLEVSGKKEELVARVYVACENNVPMNKTADEVHSGMAKECKQKLLVKGCLIPDPLTVEDGWLSEDNNFVITRGIPSANRITFNSKSKLNLVKER